MDLQAHCLSSPSITFKKICIVTGYRVCAVTVCRYCCENAQCTEVTYQVPLYIILKYNFLPNRLNN